MPIFEYVMPEPNGVCPVCEAKVDPEAKNTRGPFCSPRCKNDHRYAYMRWFGEMYIQPQIKINENAKILRPFVNMKKPVYETTLKALLKLGFKPEHYTVNLAPDGHERKLLEIGKYYVEILPGGKCKIEYIPFLERELYKKYGHLIQKPFTQA